MMSTLVFPKLSVWELAQKSNGMLSEMIGALPQIATDGGSHGCQPQKIGEVSERGHLIGAPALASTFDSSSYSICFDNSSYGFL